MPSTGIKCIILYVCTMIGGTYLLMLFLYNPVTVSRIFHCNNTTLFVGIRLLYMIRQKYLFCCINDFI